MSLNQDQAMACVEWFERNGLNRGGFGRIREEQGDLLNRVVAPRAIFEAPGKVVASYYAVMPEGGKLIVWGWRLHRLCASGLKSENDLKTALSALSAFSQFKGGPRIIDRLGDLFSLDPAGTLSGARSSAERERLFLAKWQEDHVLVQEWFTRVHKRFLGELEEIRLTLTENLVEATRKILEDGEFLQQAGIAYNQPPVFRDSRTDRDATSATATATQASARLEQLRETWGQTSAPAKAMLRSAIDFYTSLLEAARSEALTWEEPSQAFHDAVAGEIKKATRGIDELEERMNRPVPAGTDLSRTAEEILTLFRRARAALAQLATVIDEYAEEPHVLQNLSRDPQHLRWTPEQLRLGMNDLAKTEEILAQATSVVDIAVQIQTLPKPGTDLDSATWPRRHIDGMKARVTQARERLEQATTGTPQSADLSLASGHHKAAQAIDTARATLAIAEELTDNANWFHQFITAAHRDGTANTQGAEFVPGVTWTSPADFIDLVSTKLWDLNTADENLRGVLLTSPPDTNDIAVRLYDLRWAAAGLASLIDGMDAYCQPQPCDLVDWLVSAENAAYCTKWSTRQLTGAKTYLERMDEVYELARTAGQNARDLRKLGGLVEDPTVTPWPQGLIEEVIHRSTLALQALTQTLATRSAQTS
ncbi:hypothetical protein OG331_48680 [Streptomyces sp. NBC_01017]|uniref:hypothetical protein n=1 Tax=Streptomyces sp. NBC_01017 TaxID=2903721 RepID=UPI00386AF602|nr:hypothetical protein OG331_03295 [Streptomyces sp. NBC_01017]WSV34903.1 hypothetical protein OG331_48680 [Streptomyces sp. NBC_01017]